ncbi:MAG: glycosyl hydrolase family protein [Acidimicrobiales bacterium]|nr:family 16 glycosylhydrolase [Hyphomonadaceae bacterium]RZV41500.1 MAG: glycosyl hydrolase family protein [Acidimicrobiales bacterium]
MKQYVVILGLVSATLVSCQTNQTHTINEKSGLQAYAGYPGAYEGFTLKVDERFDAFDQSLWRTGDGAVGGESMCRFQPSGVKVENGNLILEVRKEDVPPGWSNDHEQQKGPYDYVCGEVRTIDNVQFRYGRIEARMKAPNRETASGYISSLFTYRFDTDPMSETPESKEWEEIDVELEGGRPDKFQANLIYGKDTWEWWRTRQYGAWEDKIEVGPVDQWRVFAVEWMPDALRWYVDGELVKTLTSEDLDCDPECVDPQEFPTPIPNNPTAVMMNFWIPVDDVQDHFGGNKKRNQYPMATEYDWFRYYELESHPNKG